MQRILGLLPFPGPVSKGCIELFAFSTSLDAQAHLVFARVSGIYIVIFIMISGKFYSLLSVLSLLSVVSISDFVALAIEVLHDLLFAQSCDMLRGPL